MTPSRPKRVLFVCVENSNRGQPAEAFARIHGGGQIEAYSAGSKPSGVINPRAIEAMRELGYDLSVHGSKSLDDLPTDREWDFVATMGCGDACPLLHTRRREDWSLPDPRNPPPAGISPRAQRDRKSGQNDAGQPMSTIRQAQPQDFEAVRSLLAASDVVHEDLTPVHLEDFVVIPTRAGTSLAAVAGVEHFAGAADGILRSVAVAAAVRGQGVGADLVAAVEHRATALGLRRLWLLTTTAPDFFRRLGYVDTPRARAPAGVRQTAEFQSLCPASAVCLRKAL